MENKEQIEKLAEDISVKQNELATSIEAKASSESVTELKSELDTLKAAHDEAQIVLKSQGEALAKQKEIELDEAVSYVMKNLREKKEAISKLKGAHFSKESTSFDLNLKAIVASANAVDTTISSRVPGIGAIPFRRRFLEDVFNSSSVGDNNGNTLVYTDQANVNRAAGNIAECAEYPALSDIDWIEKSCKIEKIGDSIKVCLEAMDDFDFVESEIRDLLITSVDQRVDSQILLGDGVTPNIKGISLSASTFAAGDFALEIPTPSMFDLIDVAQSQISTLGLGMYMADTALVNPVDLTKLRATKDSTGQWISAPYATDGGLTVAGVRLIENTLVPANEMYVFDSTKATVYNRKSLSIQMAFENEDDFDKDLVTIKASRRLTFLIRDVWANAFTHVPDITAAITAITKP